MSDQDLTRLTIAEARNGLKAKEFSARELVEAYLAAIEAGNAALNAYVATTPERALEMAAESDKRLAGKGRGKVRPLEGIPLGVKDLFATRGVHTQAASHILDGFKPTYESTVTAKLWADGAVMLGKLNMDEFAMGSSNENSYYGPVVNPWRATATVQKGKKSKEGKKSNEGKNGGTASAPLVPGGSSGGSAAAVAARLAAGTIGTDTGGSIRQPAAFTGTVGLKPTYGRCSRWGIVAFASSLDQAGPFARTVRDAAILLRSMAGHDAKDSTSADRPVPDYEKALEKGVKGLKVGVPREYRVDGMSDEIAALWEKGIAWLEAAGAEVRELSLPHTKYALPAYYIVAPAEASSNLARYDGVRYGLRVEADDIISMYEETRAAGFGAEVKRRVLIGTYVLSAGYYDAYYLQAQKVRTLIRRDFEEAFSRVDVLLTPTTPSPAFAIGAKVDDPLEMYLSDILTVPVNMAGVAGISVPAGLSGEGTPLGLQLIAAPFAEETLFRAAQVIEDAAGLFSPPDEWWLKAEGSAKRARHGSSRQPASSRSTSSKAKSPRAQMGAKQTAGAKRTKTKKTR